MKQPDLQTLLGRAKQLPLEDIPRFLGDLEEIKATAMARLVSPGPLPQRDELIDVANAAKRLGVSEDYLYRHHSSYPFTRREGRKLLFSNLGIDAYIKTKNSKTVLTAKQRERILSLSHSR